MLRTRSGRWWTVPTLVLALVMVLGVASIRMSALSADAAARPTCPPLVFAPEIDPAVALRDTGLELDCRPPAFKDPGPEPEKHAVPLPSPDPQAP